MAFKDHFSEQADRYTKFRPRYPRDLFAYLATLPQATDLAWDCGTGNGQAAVGLADYFGEVLATDPSERQISHADPHPRVRYEVAPAEACPLPDASADLVTVAQAVHWFDRPAFYAEVRRVARSGSVIALWAYALAEITPEVDAVVWHLYGDILGKYWPPERHLIMEHYQTLDFPFDELRAPSISMTAQWTLDNLLGYLSTWSSAQKYFEQHGSNALDLVRDKLKAAWGKPESAERAVHWPLILRVGRILP